MPSSPAPAPAADVVRDLVDDLRRHHTMQATAELFDACQLARIYPRGLAVDTDKVTVACAADEIQRLRAAVASTEPERGAGEDAR